MERAKYKVLSELKCPTESCKYQSSEVEVELEFHVYLVIIIDRRGNGKE